MENVITIGLFGTCGNSTWRNRFIEFYDQSNIQYYNPQVVDWKPEDAEIEAHHLVNDEIILFPVTSETYGTGSLSETGFSIMQALRSTKNRFVVIMIDPIPDESLRSDMVAFKESARSRALVRAHLKNVNQPNVFVVETLDQMLQTSLLLHAACVLLQSAREIR